MSPRHNFVNTAPRGWRLCSACRRVLPEEKMFERRSDSNDGWRKSCRDCRRRWLCIAGCGTATSKQGQRCQPCYLAQRPAPKYRDKAQTQAQAQAQQPTRPKLRGAKPRTPCKTCGGALARQSNHTGLCRRCWEAQVAKERLERLKRESSRNEGWTPKQPSESTKRSHGLYDGTGYKRTHKCMKCKQPVAFAGMRCWTCSTGRPRSPVIAGYSGAA